MAPSPTAAAIPGRAHVALRARRPRIRDPRRTFQRAMAAVLVARARASAVRWGLGIPLRVPAAAGPLSVPRSPFSTPTGGGAPGAGASGGAGPGGKQLSGNAKAKADKERRARKRRSKNLVFKVRVPPNG
jgi:hypothetical protein